MTKNLTLTSDGRRFDLRIEGAPIAQPRPRFNRYTGHAYNDDKHPVVAYRESIVWAWRELHIEPLAGPLLLAVEFVLPRPETKIWKRKAMHRERHIGKNDLDNFVKACVDGLGDAGAFRNDNQIVSMQADTWICSGCEQPHTLVTAVELG